MDQAVDGTGAPVRAGAAAPLGGSAAAPLGARAASRRVRPGERWRVRWSAAMKETFLDHLAATCNVKDAAAAIGVGQSSVYFLRRRDPAFAAAWSEALVMGYEMLETRLVGHALAGGESRILAPGDAEGGAIDVALALRLLTCHRRALNGRPSRRGRPPHVATPEETNAAILKKLRVMEAQQRAEEAAIAARPAALAIVDGRTGAVAADDAEGSA